MIDGFCSKRSEMEDFHMRHSLERTDQLTVNIIVLYVLM